MRRSSWHGQVRHFQNAGGIHQKVHSICGCEAEVDQENRVEQQEYRPLVRIVKIKVKAAALSTGMAFQKILRRFSVTLH